MKIPDYNKKIKHPTYLEMQEEIERLTAESTKWESKFYDEAKKVDKAIEYIEQLTNDEESIELMDIDSLVQEELLNILKGSDKDWN